MSSVADALFLGIDLGTTNSVQAVHDGDSLRLVRGGDGSILTPSVVRVDARGRVSVGARARAFLSSDPNNTRAEFKRLMGSQHRLAFDAARLTRTPTELSAEVLRSLRRDYAEQLGHEPMRAIVSVPALFELPQLDATSEAARLAGFERVEFIQEPIASALAAGWAARENSGSWLVYDLGGGTFDVSLLESREGLLHVVGHDGDNFLGGRDIDQGLSDWVLSRLAEDGTKIDVSEPRHASALRRLRAAAEVAKIELTRSDEADITVADLFQHEGQSVGVDLVVTRQVLEAIVAPLVDRSLEVCLRLLADHGLTAAQLERVVLVGGPTLIPSVRARIAAALPAVSGTLGDPMSLVAEGAALFALSRALNARGVTPAQNPRAPSVWLQYAAASADSHPYVVGKVGAPAGADPVKRIVIERDDGGFSSGEVALDAEHAFAVTVELILRGRSTFKIFGVPADGARIALEPPTFTIAHGVNIGDPPLSRSIGVGLASGDVQVFFEKGSPLPLRRSFTLNTVETVSPGNTGFALYVPIVQGELPLSHLCRLVGQFEIPAEDVHTTVPAGSEVEITLELDRGGRLLASARIGCIDQQFSHVAQLVMPELSPEAMRETEWTLARRGAELRREVSRSHDQRALRLLEEADRHLAEAGRAIELAKGGDPDAGERARRLLLEIDGLLSEAELLRGWPKLVEETRYYLSYAAGSVGRYGTETERQLFESTAQAIERALARKSVTEVTRQLEVARRIGSAAYYRQPEAWPLALNRVSARVHELFDPPKGKALLEEGRKAIAQGNLPGVERAVRALWELLPPDPEDRRRGYDSGVR
jgi:molecular chaperone DnaK